MAPSGTRTIAVQAGGRLLAVRRLSGRRFDFYVALPRSDTTVGITTTDARGRRSRAIVDHVFGLPPAARPRGSLAHVDPVLARRIVPLVRSFPGSSAVYVRDLQTGAGAAWNARAHFPAASTLKVAIAVEVLRTLRGKPAPGSYADSLLRRALIYSDNGAANDLEVMFGGSTSGGSARVNALMRGLGLYDSEMYGGYERGTAARKPIPLRRDEQPYYGRGKHTSAFDLAQLFALVHLAAEGKGRLAKRYGSGFTPSDARYLLYLVSHSADHGKLDRFLGGTGASVAHKAGWIASARHDAGLVYWRGGVFAVSVMTYGYGVGTASDVLAGRVALRALDQLTAARQTAVTRASNPIQAENSRTGTTAWNGPIAPQGAVEGYASQVSVFPGQTIQFHVATAPAAPYQVQVYRLGWYDGAGGRLMASARNTGQPRPRVAGERGAGWPVTDTVRAGRDWASGYYLARFELTAGPQAGKGTYTVFVVRDPAPHASRILVQASVNTWQAYNNWGGKSLYDFNSPGGRAARVSFLRPYAQTWDIPQLPWEIPILRFLERRGYDLSYQSDVDTHRNPQSLLRHRLIVVAGHGEYWTSRMRNAFEAARATGTNLAFLGANIGYWQIRYEDGERTIVGYKSTSDPVTDPALQTVQFRQLTPPRPECSLLGVQWEEGLAMPGDAPRAYRVASPGDPWFTGTGFTSETEFPESVGYEWDVHSCAQPDVTVLFHYDGGPSNADGVRYTAASGARVFSAGSLAFAYLLDSWRSGSSDAVTVETPGIQRFMANALADMERPARPVTLRAQVRAGAVELTVRRAPDPRVRDVVIRRDGKLVCRTTGARCVDHEPPPGRHVYSAVSVDDWGRSVPVTVSVRVPKRTLAGRVALRTLYRLRANARAVRKRDQANALVARSRRNSRVRGRDRVVRGRGGQEKAVRDRDGSLVPLVVRRP